MIKNHSNHYLILLHCDKGWFGSARSFKFMRVWTLCDRCIQLTTHNWNIGAIDCPVIFLCAKLRSLKPIFKKCNKDIFGNFYIKVIQVTDEVNKIQSFINGAS